MRKVWLTLNVNSGSTDEAARGVIETALAKAGVEIAKCSDFPDAPLPGPAELDAAGVDTLVVCGGDGTLGAAAAAAEGWDGQCLLLPGGTMNILPKALHGNAGIPEVIAAAVDAPSIHLPFAGCEHHRALAGVIVGPAAAWVHARERLRVGRWAGLRRALLFAWRKSWRRTVRVVGATDHPGGHRAVVLTPLADGLEISSVAAENWFEAARLGWNWLAGDWRNDPRVKVSVATEVCIAGGRTVSALFDGEPAVLPSPATLRHGHTKLRFVRTLPKTDAVGTA